MKGVDEVKERPIQYFAAIMLIGVGIGISAGTTMTWADPLGGAMAATGGALLSHIVSDVGHRKKAVDCLKPELQSTAGHLAATVTKISRNIQVYQSGALDSETAIDRIAQLTSSLYATLNDLHMMVGTPPDFEMLVETVNNCEQMAARLEQLTDSTHKGEPVKPQELDQLREQLQSARMQLVSAKKEFGGIEIAKTEERVKCPVCSNETTVMLGKTQGDSAIHTCVGCGQRFHVHRDAQAKTFTRPWGGVATTRIEVACPNCAAKVPLNFHRDRACEDRYCMQCACLLRITSDERVAKIKDPAPVRVEAVSYHGVLTLLTCPKCSTDTPTIWGTPALLRAVCRRCGDLLEYVKPATGSSDMPNPTANVGGP